MGGKVIPFMKFMPPIAPIPFIVFMLKFGGMKFPGMPIIPGFIMFMFMLGMNGIPGMGMGKFMVWFPIFCIICDISGGIIWLNGRVGVAVVAGTGVLLGFCGESLLLVVLSPDRCLFISGAVGARLFESDISSALLFFDPTLPSEDPETGDMLPERLDAADLTLGLEAALLDSLSCFSSAAFSALYASAFSWVSVSGTSSSSVTFSVEQLGHVRSESIRAVEIHSLQ